MSSHLIIRVMVTAVKRRWTLGCDGVGRLVKAKICGHLARLFISESKNQVGGEAMAVVLTGYIKVSRSERRVIQQHLAQHIQNTRHEAGCLAFEVNQSAEDDCVFTVFECFKDQAAFEFQQARVKISLWGEISRNAERVYSIETRDAATSVKAL
ncbi:antibiotic biosynthesis monooxygenase [Pseudomonadales bacterium]|nr:antibiotic biosynthesis monooxygenase [Pseudomonadales bacterium]